MIATIRLIILVLGLLLTLLVLLPIHLPALVLARMGYPLIATWSPVVFHRAALALMGVRLTVDGTLPKHRPLLIVANHVSWLDIAVLGAMAPLSFVAKSEMQSWPVFGWLAFLQRTIFIRRASRREAGHQANSIAERMTAREIIVLFPEGTTTDGNKLAAFKTPLFEAARFALVNSPVHQAIVQPVAINYDRLHGLPMGRAKRPHVAWPGEIGLVESLVGIVSTGALDVTVKMSEAINFTEESKRKIVSAQAHKAIRDMLTRVDRSTSHQGGAKDSAQ